MAFFTGGYSTPVFGTGSRKLQRPSRNSWRARFPRKKAIFGRQNILPHLPTLSSPLFGNGHDQTIRMMITNHKINSSEVMEMHECLCR